LQFFVQNKLYVSLSLCIRRIQNAGDEHFRQPIFTALTHYAPSALVTGKSWSSEDRLILKTAMKCRYTGR